MRSNILPNPTDTRRVYLVLGFLIVLAWSLLAAWQSSTYAELLGHESIEDNSIPFVLHLVAFLLSWFLMTVAMMLPGSLPMLTHFIQPARYRVEDILLVGLSILGYLAPWVLFGLLVFLGDSFLHEMAEPTGPLSAFSSLIAPAIVLIAGLYQFTPAKRHYMVLCRNPYALSVQSYEEQLRRTRALQQGLRLGVFCVGSC